MYILQWKNPGVDPNKTAITVPVGSVVSNAASLVFTGKGAANYGKLQQENLMRLLENFADGTAPAYPTVGQLWYDTTSKVLKLFSDSTPATWKTIAGVQVTDVGEPAPNDPMLGELWLQRTGPASCVLYVYNGLGRFPAAASTIGGWSQVWPQVDAAGLREEYDEIRSLVSQLITASSGGSGADGLLFPYLTSFSTLDADMAAKLTALGADTNVTSPASTDVAVQPYSADWDYLLSAAKWAVRRLDVPATLADDISTIPFVQDGRQAPSTGLLSAYPRTDVRYPSLERRTSRRYGSVTMNRLYTETYNVLRAAVVNRYSLRGIAGGSSIYPSFAPDVVKATHNQRAGTLGTGGTVITQLRWNSQAERDRFVYGGNAVEITLGYSGGSDNASDLLFKAFIAAYKTVRVTADKVRFFSDSAPMVLADAPTASGFTSATSGYTVLASRSLGGCTVSISSNFAAGSALGAYVGLTLPAGLSGTVVVTCSVIRDCTTQAGSTTDLFPAPLPFNPATDASAPGAGSTTGTLSNVALTTPPVADFSVSATSGTTSTTFTFTYTGSGSPTSIEWDLTGNGETLTTDAFTVSATGATATASFATSGLKTVRVRATNAGGQDVVSKVAVISVA